MMFPLLEAASTGFAQLGMALGAGLATIGAGLGIGKIGSSAMEAIEGVALFAVAACAFLIK